MVTETVCRVPLEDLQTIRIRCAKCQKVAEVSVRAAAGMHPDGTCRFCQEDFFDEHGQDAFRSLANAFAQFERIRKQVSVEFVIHPAVTGPTKS